MVAGFSDDAAAPDRQILGQPAGRQTRRSVGVTHQPDQAFDPAIRRQGGDGIFARARRGPVPFRQADLDDVARGPVRARPDRLEREVIGRPARTARIDHGPLDQPPRIEGRRRPVGRRETAGDLVQLVLPAADGPGLAVVDLDQVEQGFGARPPQPAVHRMAEAAEMVVASVAQGQQAEAQARQIRPLPHGLAHEPRRCIGRVAFARRGHDQQGPAGRLQRRAVQIGEGQNPRPHTAVLQGLGRHPGQLLGETRLAGEGDQHALAVSGHGVRLGARRRLRPAFAPDDEAGQDQPQGRRTDGPQPTRRLVGHPGPSRAGSSIMAAKAGVIRSTRPRSVRSTKWAARPIASA